MTTPAWLLGPILSAVLAGSNAEPDIILHNGKIVTVDREFSIRQAMAIEGGRIVRVGSNEAVLKLRGPRTEVTDLGGKTVIPGLIDSHVHPTGASMHEFDHPIPEMETIQDVLDYIKSRADKLEPGQWIQVRQVFITRLREQRYPTREELDRVAPKNPVIFSTGPDASLNSLALKLSGIDKDFQVKDGGPGFMERDPKTGEPTGILRGMSRYVKTDLEGTVRKPTEAERDERLLRLFRDYNRVGFTGIIDRDASPDGIEQYRRLRDAGKLPLRVAANHGVGSIGDIEKVQANIRKVAEHPLREREADDMLRVIGIKTYLDGGMLTGSAYMREPWGVSKIYAITDPEYRGVLNIPKDRLLPMVRAAVESNLQFTAHSVGDGAVHTLLDVYEEVNKELPIRPTRPSITHSNFMSKEAVETAARLGVCVDIQPAWLYLDTRTLVAQFGYDRLRYFQPLRSIFAAGGIAGGGSDHMQKIGSFRSINPYNPFLAMQTAVTRKARWYDGELHPEEALTREQALRFYTINNAYIMFLDDKVGSLEAGKLADFAVLDRDILMCPVDQIKDTQALSTYLNGKQVYVVRPPAANPVNEPTTSSSQAPKPAAPQVLWKVDLASASYGGGAIGDLNGDGNLAIVFGTYFNDEHLYAVQAKDGKVLWKFKSEGGPFDASVAIADLDGDGKREVLAADSSTGTLFCLDGAGEVLWKFKLPNSTDSPPSVADLDGDGKLDIVVGTMAQGDKHGRVVVIDAATRGQKWVAKIPGHVQSEPALVDLNGDKALDVIVTTWRGDKSIHALDGKDGSELWTHAMAGDMYHGVSVFDHHGPRLVTTSIAGEVCCLDAGGKARWTKQVGGYLFAPTSIGDLDGDGTPEIIVASGRVHVLDANGDEKWKSNNFGSIGRGVALADANGDGHPDLFFGASDRRFRVLDGPTGREIWSFDATVQGHVYEWLDGAPIIADFDGDGTLDVFFVAGKGTSNESRPQNYGRAYALRAGNGKGSWDMFRGNLRRTGTNDTHPVQR
jgi:predicted amidohydrolase YtcJ/outer membrane protein assembly factor BamB